MDAAICRNLLEAAKRSKPVVSKKEPISADIIKKIIDKYAAPSASLKDLRLACMCSLRFAGFLHYDGTNSNFCLIICVCLFLVPVYRNVYLNYTVAGSRTVLKTCIVFKEKIIYVRRSTAN